MDGWCLYGSPGMFFVIILSLCVLLLNSKYLSGGTEKSLNSEIEFHPWKSGRLLVVTSQVVSGGSLGPCVVTQNFCDVIVFVDKNSQVFCQYPEGRGYESYWVWEFGFSRLPLSSKSPLLLIWLSATITDIYSCVNNINFQARVGGIETFRSSKMRFPMILMVLLTAGCRC